VDNKGRGSGDGSRGEEGEGAESAEEPRDVPDRHGLRQMTENSHRNTAKVFQASKHSDVAQFENTNFGATGDPPRSRFRILP
jgi:hypothetical protein